MSMQMRIRHTTGYHYEKGAVASFNEARMTPMTTSEQYVLRSRLEITPMPWSYEYRDYWGTTVTSFEVHDPHSELTVVATSTVETQEVPEKPHGATWAELDDVQDEWCEFLALSTWVAPSADLLAELAPRTQLNLRVRPGSPAVAAVEAWLGAPLPARTGDVTHAGHRKVLALGPDEHLVTTMWRGVFIQATCAVRVDGPARRAGSGRDAARHLRG